MKKYWVLYLTAFFAAVVISVAVYMVAGNMDVPVKILTRDPYRASAVPWYYAYFSLLGSTIWLVSGATTLMTGIILKKLLGSRLSDNSTYSIILFGGIIGLFMAVDDILLFHDVYADAIGIPELLFHIVYLISILLMILYSRTVIRLTPWVLLFAALAGFGFSSIIDVWKIFPAYLSQSEDVFKLIGIVLWAFYFMGVSWDFVKEHSS